MLATAATFNNTLYILGGTDLTPGEGNKPQRRYLTTSLRYDPARGWQRIADLPHPSVAAPSPAPTDASGLFLLGGDDGSQLTTPPDQHRGFTKTILHYDAQSNRWTTATTILPAPAVTTPCVAWHNAWIIPTGEIRPGIRSPQVWSWNPGSND
jgi:N-acetylneuraminic acid mutarotase